MPRLSLPDAVATGQHRAPLSRVPARARRTRHARRAHHALTLDTPFVAAHEALVLVEVASSHIVMWNPAAEALFGHAQHKAIGKPIDVLVPPAVARVMTERMAHYARTGDTDALNAHKPLHMPVTTLHGQEVLTELTVAPPEVAADSGTHQFVIVSFRRTSSEVLEVSRLESARAAISVKQLHLEALERQSAIELHRAQAKARRSIDRLAALVRDPLAAQDHIDVMTRVVGARTTRVHEFQSHLAELSDLRSGTFALSRERVNLVPLLGSIVAQMRTRRHRMKLAAPQSLRLLGAYRRLELVARMLVGQARRRNPRGCWIDVDLRRPLGGVARVEVRDYGRTLSPAERAALTDGSSPDSAWYLCREVVVRHGGTFRIQYPIEGGLRAIVTLPVNGGRVTAP